MMFGGKALCDGPIAARIFVWYVVYLLWSVGSVGKCVLHRVVFFSSRSRLHLSGLPVGTILYVRTYQDRFEDVGLVYFMCGCKISIQSGSLPRPSSGFLSRSMAHTYTHTKTTRTDM